MKQYELTVMIHPDLEMNIEPATDKIAELIKSVDGKIIKENNEGKKHLAYPVQGQEFAVYYYYELELGPKAPEKIDRSLGIMDEVIRHLLVQKDERKEKMALKRRESDTEEENGDESEGDDE